MLRFIHMISPSALIPCPEKYPYACGRGTKCTDQVFKPVDDSVPGCNGDVVDLFDECCPSNSIKCGSKPDDRCKSNPTNGKDRYIRSSLF